MNTMVKMGSGFWRLWVYNPGILVLATTSATPKFSPIITLEVVGSNSSSGNNLSNTKLQPHHCHRGCGFKSWLWQQPQQHQNSASSLPHRFQPTKQLPEKVQHLQHFVVADCLTVASASLLVQDKPTKHRHLLLHLFPCLSLSQPADFTLSHRRRRQDGDAWLAFPALAKKQSKLLHKRLLLCELSATTWAMAPTKERHDWLCCRICFRLADTAL